jgi:hypothetical protein
VSTSRTPRFRNASSRSRFDSVSNEYSLSGKISRSGLKESVVPVSPSLSPMTRRSLVFAPREKAMS